MSSKTEVKGANITTAVNVLIQTYETIQLLFQEMDRASVLAGFVSHTDRFMRWKSDLDPRGWLTTSFIKLYQKKGDLFSHEIEDLQSGDMYTVEINLNNDEFPQIWLCRHKFDYAEWKYMPSNSDHWLFYYPLVDDKNWFKVTQESDGSWRSKPSERARKKYWGIEGSVAMTIPLLNVNSTESVHSEIFDRLIALPEI